MFIWKQKQTQQNYIFSLNSTLKWIKHRIFCMRNIYLLTLFLLPYQFTKINTYLSYKWTKRDKIIQLIFSGYSHTIISVSISQYNGYKCLGNWKRECYLVFTFNLLYYISNIVCILRAIQKACDVVLAKLRLSFPLIQYEGVPISLLLQLYKIKNPLSPANYGQDLLTTNFLHPKVIFLFILTFPC